MKLGIIAMLSLAAFTISAWLTHVVWIIKILMGEAGPTLGQAALGVIGAIMPPIGVIHGVILWFA